METLENILLGAVQGGASDVHLKAGSAVTFRIQRELHPVNVPSPDGAWMDEVLARIVPAHMRAKLDADREADFALSLPEVGRFRANVFQQRGAYVIAFRVVRTAIRSFQDLRLPDTVQRIGEAKRGIVIIAGAPGAGKSTTLAAIIQHLNNTARKHIITLEDPIEYYFDDNLSVIEQREVGLDTASFATGLRNVLRQDPDILVIGEMRDAESVAAAVSAANVGAMAISTLHTGDAAKSLRRILEFFPGLEREQARRQLAATLHAVVCQKLVKTRSGQVLPAVEILINNASVAKLIEADRLDKLNGAIELGAGEGMQTFDQSLHQLVASGAINIGEALAHSPNPDTFRMKLRGVSLEDSHRILGVRS